MTHIYVISLGKLNHIILAMLKAVKLTSTCMVKLVSEFSDTSKIVLTVCMVITSPYFHPLTVQLSETVCNER